MRRSIVTALVLFVLLAAAAALARADAEPIRDNSFLVEEAYNQERGVVQHILTWTRDESRAWNATFTQEWPLAGLKHQISYTVPFGIRSPGESVRFGAIALNYRWQALGGTSGRPALAPRVTALVPLTSEDSGLDDRRAGLQLELPFSIEPHPRWALHANAGATWQALIKRPLVYPAFAPAPIAPTSERQILFGASIIGRVARRVNLMLESTRGRTDTWGLGHRVSRDDAFTVSPGARVAFDTASGKQLVPGLAFPIGVGPSRGEHAVLLYMSVEHAF